MFPKTNDLTKNSLYKKLRTSLFTDATFRETLLPLLGNINDYVPDI